MLELRRVLLLRHVGRHAREWVEPVGFPVHGNEPRIAVRREGQVHKVEHGLDAEGEEGRKSAPRKLRYWGALHRNLDLIIGDRKPAKREDLKGIMLCVADVLLLNLKYERRIDSLKPAGRDEVARVVLEDVVAIEEEGIVPSPKGLPQVLGVPLVGKVVGRVSRKSHLTRILPPDQAVLQLKVLTVARMVAACPSVRKSLVPRVPLHKREPIGNRLKYRAKIVRR